MEEGGDPGRNVLFQYYEKSMVHNMGLHKRSAMPEITRRSTLNQELIRRMVNSSEMVTLEKRVEIVDKYAVKPEARRMEQKERGSRNRN